MIYTRRLSGLLCCLLFLAVCPLMATDVGSSQPSTQTEEKLAPAALDETTLELFVSAVADMHNTAKNLATRLDVLEIRVVELRATNKSMETENKRLRKLVKLQKAVPDSWHAWPLDKEVKQANRLLERLVSGLAGMTPVTE